MKLKSILFLLLIMAIPFQVEAHTHLESSEPEEGEGISAESPIITLTFDSAVQEPNVIRVTDESGEETTIDNITHSPENVIEVTLPEDIAGGELDLFYSIVGADGHVMEDELSFTYESKEEAEDTEEIAQSEKEAEEQAEEQAAAEDTESESQESQSQETEETQSESAEESQSSSLMPVLIVVLIGAAVAGFLMVRKKG
ncbi:copper resistance CopC family protein [Halobacillus sp. K22]|uniref:copper resistance CopC family protein n=1 Tax=Halobacillus sp. K22 TaxID=3457431 RepID=UPI003FCD7DE6